MSKRKNNLDRFFKERDYKFNPVAHPIFLFCSV